MATPTQLLRLPGVRTLTGKGRTTLFEAWQDGRFPPPLRLGRAIAWPLAEVEEINRAHIRGDNSEQLRELVRRLVAARANGGWRADPPAEPAAPLAGTIVGKLNGEVSAAPRPRKQSRKKPSRRRSTGKRSRS